MSDGGQAPAVPAIGVRPGGNMPMVGFGIWRLKGEVAYTSVLTALATGYRLVDTATAYGNPREVGRALTDSGIPRCEVFVTTKLMPASGNKARQGTGEEPGRPRPEPGGPVAAPLPAPSGPAAARVREHARPAR